MDIPNHVKQILQDRELPLEKKMVAFMAFMPRLPDDPKMDAMLEENIEIGKKIKSLLDEGKITYEELNLKIR